MEGKRWIGVDPGEHGGVAVVWEKGEPAQAWPMPATPLEILRLLEEIGVTETERASGYSPAAVLEKVHAIPDWGTSGAILMQNYGQLEVALFAAGVRFTRVLPKDWQPAVGVPLSQHDRIPKTATTEERKTARTKRAKEARERKVRLRARAQELFPDAEVTNATADALLLAWYARKEFA